MRGEVRELHLIPPVILDDLLAIFFVSVRKEGGKEYEPCTLKGMHSSIARYLKEHSYSNSLVTSAEFFKSREAIRSKCRQLKKQGKGNKPNKKRAPTQEEIKKMWESGALGSATPETLQHTIWWIVNTRFGKRVNKENQGMKWGDILLKTNATGKKYLTYNERETKTRQGDNIADIKGPIKVFEDTDYPKYCPVRHFEMYAKARPTSMCEPQSRFYLQPKKFSDQKSAESELIWYKNQPHGINSLQKYMHIIVNKAGIAKDVTLSNISVRKHLVSTSKKAGVPDSTTIKVGLTEITAYCK
jgi:hypothetical protein